jgi:lysophospholipase L1-like esterase
MLPIGRALFHELQLGRYLSLLTCGLLLAGCASITTKDAGVVLNLNPLAGEESPLRNDERLAFLGDSITHYGGEPTGYIGLIEQAVSAKQRDKKIEIVKAGINGNKVTDLRRRLDEDVLSKKPTLVFVYIGINDVWHWELTGHGTTKADFEAGLRDVIQRIQNQGATVVLATPSVIGEKANGSNQHDADLDAYANITRKVAKEQGIVLCDLRAAFRAYLKAYNATLELDRGILTVDSVHLSDRGNRLVANCAATSIAQALRETARKATRAP